MPSVPQAAADAPRGAALGAVLDAVGTGTALTVAGYLAPALVEQIAPATGVTQR